MHWERYRARIDRDEALTATLNEAESRKHSVFAQESLAGSETLRSCGSRKKGSAVLPALPRQKQYADVRDARTYRYLLTRIIHAWRPI